MDTLANGLGVYPVPYQNFGINTAVYMPTHRDSDFSPSLYESDLNPGAACFQAGDILANRYEIEALMRQGGTSQVYKARDLHTDDRAVAIKVVHPLLQNRREFQVALHAEAASLRAWNHPNIVRYVDEFTFGLENYALVMEWLEGETLSELLARSGSLPQKVWMDLIQQWESTLTWLHQTGALHGDIKPANLFITSNREAKFIDFSGPYLPGTTSRLYSAPSRAGQPLAPCDDVYAFASLLLDLEKQPDFEGFSTRQFELLESVIQNPCEYANGGEFAKAWKQASAWWFF